MDGIETIIASDTFHEELVAEIYLDGKFVAQVTQEHGPEKMRLEFPEFNRSDRHFFARDVDLTRFLRAVDIATKRLLGEMP